MYSGQYTALIYVQWTIHCMHIYADKWDSSLMAALESVIHLLYMLQILVKCVSYAIYPHVYVYLPTHYRTNTFQGILMTDGSSKYAVFIYKCGSMEWGGGVIGWQASTSEYNSHYLSGESNSSEVGCLYSDTYSAIVFKIDNGMLNLAQRTAA